jgi:predicted hydrolase (HD superfamily)
VRFAVGVSRDRILYKFCEKRFGKLERVYELIVEYMDGIVEKNKNK